MSLEKPKPKASKLTLYLILLVCILPTIAAFYAYYFVRWEPNTETTNYGKLVIEQPQVPVMPSAVTLDGKSFDSKIIYKKWVYVVIAPSACDASCATKLYTTRQLKAIAGRERERVERLWWVTDGAQIDPVLLNAHPDLKVVRVAPSDLAFIAPYAVDKPDAHIWMIDPIGKLFMQYPIEPDPNKMKRDLTKLLYASKGWQQ